MKKLKFQPHLAKKILNGEKTTTWRLFDDKDLTIGDEIELYENGIEKPFEVGKIVEIVEKPLGELTDNDWVGHERFDSEEEMYATYRKYYGPSVDEKTIVKIISFKLVK